MSEQIMKDIVAASGVQFGTSGARGLVSQMSDAVCYAYAQAFLKTVAADAPLVIIGHDLRPSSPAMAAACAQAVADAGKTVRFVGALPTPAVAFYAMSLSAPSIIVTGSHIPFDRNGIKFYRASGEITKADESAMLETSVTIPEGLAPAALPAVDSSATSAYLDRYISFFGESALAGMRIALYQHSSVARDLLPQLLERLGAEVLALGRAEGFVPIDTEAVRPEDVEQAQQWAREHRFDALLSTDGDADRPLIGDERGVWLRGDIVGILCAQYLGANVVITPVSRNTAVETCSSFRQVLRTRIGSPYVIAGMESAVADDPQAKVAGYEANGGFLLGSDVERADRRLTALPTRDAVLPMLALLCMARQQGGALSVLSRNLPQRFTVSDRIQNVPTALSKALIERLSEDLGDAATLLAPDGGAINDADRTDGLRLRFTSGDIVHLRPSGNAPELRCYTEAGEVSRATTLCADVLQKVAALTKDAAGPAATA